MQLIEQTRSLLLVIDIQNDFCTGGALAVPDAEAVLAPSNRLINAFDQVVLTQDWHKAGHSSFASSHQDGVPFTEITAPYGAQTLWPDHCVQASNGAQFHAELAQHKAQMIIRKGFRPAIDSYSAFFENDRTTTTGLTGYLRSRGVDTVVLCGLALDFCVAYSALDARREDFNCLVVTDACRAIDLDGSASAALTKMRDNGVQLVNTSAALAAVGTR